MPENEPQHTTSPPPEDPALTQLRQRAEQAERELAFRRALAGVDWFDPEDAYRELSHRAERGEDGKWYVKLPAQSPVAGGGRSESPRVAPEEAARDLAQRKPHWVRARVLGGSGAGGGSGASAGAGLTYADLLRPENSARLQEYIHERPEELERLRQAHFNR